jgi:hypothetical protein
VCLLTFLCFSKRSDTINEIQGTILALKEYASDLQTFLGSKSIEVEVEKQEKFVESKMGVPQRIQFVPAYCSLF